MTTQVSTSLLMHSAINRTAVLLLNPYKSKQTMIYNSHDLWSPGVLKYHHLLSYLFIHAPTTDEEKTRYRCIGWFHSKPAHVFIMHNKSKTTWSVRAICCLCCSLLLGKMISCFVNCSDGDACILMGHFRYPCIFVESKWIIAERFVTRYFFLSAWLLTFCLWDKTRQNYLSHCAP